MLAYKELQAAILSMRIKRTHIQKETIRKKKLTKKKITKIKIYHKEVIRDGRSKNW